MAFSDCGPEGDKPTRVEVLRARGFRNLTELVLEPGNQFNVFFGENGAGKSNVLEALAYVASLRSFRNAPKDEIICKGAEQALLAARVSGDGPPREYKISLSRGRARQVSLDGKRPRSLAAYFGSLQRVVFHPSHTELSVGGPEGRRNLLDQILEQVDENYCRLQADYTKALRSRNRLLKAGEPDRASIVAYDGLLAKNGAYIGAARDELVRQMAPLVEKNFAEITEQALPLRVRYAPRTEPDVEGLERALADSYRKDLARGYTGVGPHVDDLQLSVVDVPAKHHASQGQHRAIVLAFKVAEQSVLAQRTGHIPLLLLDDVSSELDRRRNRRFFELLAQLGGQVFLTTTHPEFIVLEGASRSDFQVVKGRVSLG